MWEITYIDIIYQIAPCDWNESAAIKVKLYMKELIFRMLLCVDSENREPGGESSRYTVKFPPVQHVTEVEMVNIIYNHCAPVIDATNNTLTWENENSPDHNSIEIPMGNYTHYTMVETLKTCLNSKASGCDFNLYEFRVMTDRVTETINFIQLSGKQVCQVQYDKPFEALVNHSKHGLQNHSEIFVSDDARCQHSVSGYHIIQIIDENHYSFPISKSEKELPMTIPEKKFIQLLKRFRFIYTDTSLLSVLGFPAQGTAFKTKQTNADGKIMNLAGATHYYMRCPQLSGNIAIDSGIKDVFAIILLDTPSGAILYNSFQAGIKRFEHPVTLDKIDIEILTKDGKRVHSRGGEQFMTFKLKTNSDSQAS